MNEVIEHVKEQLLKTTVSQSVNGANALGVLVNAYTQLLHTMGQLEFQQFNVNMTMIERGMVGTTAESTTESTLVVAR